LTPLRIINDIYYALGNFTKKTQIYEEKCKDHDQALIYYCLTCNNSLCSDCAMFGKAHNGHEFEHVSKIYDKHLQLIKTEQEIVLNRLNDYKTHIEEVINTLEKLQRAKDEKTNEINIIVEQVL